MKKTTETNPVLHPRGIPRQASFFEPIINPFVYNLKLSPIQKLQVVLMSFTIAPLRIFLLAVFFLLTWAWAVIATIGLPVYPQKPLGPIRNTLCNTIRVLGRGLLFLMGFHSIYVKGKRAPTSEAPILVAAPHSSMFDVLLSFVTAPLPSSVSRFENYQTPLIGTLTKAVQPVFVTRNDPNSRRKTISEISRRIRMIGKWPQILIFPEGTCTNRKALITFKAGAFIPGAPVQPVLIEYLNDLDTVTWTMNGPDGLKLLWLSLCQFSLKVRVTYLPVYTPAQSEIDDPKLYAYNVRNLMADSLGIPCTDHTFEDCRLMRRAADLDLPMEAGLIEFTKLSQKLGINIDSIQDKLSEFSQIAHLRSDGKISIKEFSEFLNVPISSALQAMFAMYDRDHSGLIDFREYVIGLSLVSQPAVTESSVRLAFSVFDNDQNGMITENEFNLVLHATFGDKINGSQIFSDIQKSCPDRVTYEEFYSFASNRPEYAKLFVWFSEMGQDYLENHYPDLSVMINKPKKSD